MRVSRSGVLIALAVLAASRDGGAADPAPDGASAPAAGVLERAITFREAVELAMAYNLGLETARIDTLIRRFAVSEQDAAWDWELESTIGAAETMLPSRSTLSGADVVETDSANFVFGLTKPLRVGPSLGLEWRADRTFTNSSFSTINPAYDTALALRLDVPLLQGRGRRSQEANLRAAQAGLFEARHAQADRLATLMGEVSQAYWDLVARQSSVAVVGKSLEVAREIEASERRKAQPDIGRSTTLDVTQAEAESKRREAALIQAQRDVEDAADRLRALVLPFTGAEGDRVRLVAAETPVDRYPIPDLEQAVADSLAVRPDLLQIDAELSRLREQIALAEDRLRPTLDLSANLTYRGVDGQFGGSATDTLSGKTPSVGAELTFSMPLGRRAARAVLRQRELELARARLRRQDKVNTIIVEVRQAHRALRTAILEIEATREEVRAAGASLDGERRRLERGSSTILDVARLEENLTLAELRLLEARTALEIARINVLRASGTLLEVAGLEFDGDFRPQAVRPPSTSRAEGSRAP